MRTLKLRTSHPILTMAERADYKRAAKTGQAAWEISTNKDAKAERWTRRLADDWRTLPYAAPQG